MNTYTKIIVLAVLLSFAGSLNAQDVSVGARLNVDTAVTSIDTGADIDESTNVRANTNMDSTANVTATTARENASTRRATAEQTRKERVETANEHRSEVAAYVAGLLDVADRDAGIGAKVRVVAESQNEASADNEEALAKINSRSKIKTFLFGSDYRNLGALRSSMVRTQNEITELKTLLLEAATPEIKADLETQIQAMETVEAKINAFIEANQTRMTLFGWIKNR